MWSGPRRRWRFSWREGGTDVGALAEAQAHLAWVWAGAGRARDAVVLASRAAGLLLGHRGNGARPQGDRARPGQLWEEGLRARGEDEDRAAARG
ncbi:hypothetical protein ACFSTC_48490 [Nonomuraea ferruginea]